MRELTDMHGHRPRGMVGIGGCDPRPNALGGRRAYFSSLPSSCSCRNLRAAGSVGSRVRTSPSTIPTTGMPARRSDSTAWRVARLTSSVTSAAVKPSIVGSVLGIPTGYDCSAARSTARLGGSTISVVDIEGVISRWQVCTYSLHAFDELLCSRRRPRTRRKVGAKCVDAKEEFV